MVKKKLGLFLLFCLTVFVSYTNVKADIIPGTNYDLIANLSLYDSANQELYEFENEEVLIEFIENTTGMTSRSYSPSERRTVVNRTYEKIHTSANQITTVSGGANGATMSLNHGVSIAVEGVTSSISQGVSYLVPRHRRGNIVLKTKMKYTEYRMESRIKTGYNQYTAWKYAGSYTVKKVISNWYAPVYW